MYDTNNINLYAINRRQGLFYSYCKSKPIEVITAILCSVYARIR